MEPMKRSQDGGYVKKSGKTRKEARFIYVTISSYENHKCRSQLESYFSLDQTDLPRDTAVATCLRSIHINLEIFKLCLWYSWVSSSGTSELCLCFFADDVVLLPSLDRELQLELVQFDSVCEATGMQISTLWWSSCIYGAFQTSHRRSEVTGAGAAAPFLLFVDVSLSPCDHFLLWSAAVCRQQLVGTMTRIPRSPDSWDTHRLKCSIECGHYKPLAPPCASHLHLPFMVLPVHGGRVWRWSSVGFIKGAVTRCACCRVVWWSEINGEMCICRWVWFVLLWPWIWIEYCVLMFELFRRDTLFVWRTFWIV